MNNTIENVQKEKYTLTELEQIADKILDEITKEIDDFYVNAGVEFGKITVFLFFWAPRPAGLRPAGGRPYGVRCRSHEQKHICK